MNDFSGVDAVRALFAGIAREKLPELNLKELKVSYDEDLSMLLAKRIAQLTQDISRLASSRGDALATQSALIHIRGHAMSLCGFFDNIAEDAEYLLLEAEWPSIPEDYAAP